MKDSFGHFRNAIVALKTTPMPTSRKDVQPSDHPARIFPHDHGTFWRAPRPIHRLRAHEWDRAWTEEAQPQQKPAEKTNP